MAAKPEFTRHSRFSRTATRPNPAAEDLPRTLPCFAPENLYAHHARATMARLLSDYLASRKPTVTEFIHRADALAKFENTGTLYQHAIQKIAVAQAELRLALTQSAG